jgi:hypothetical protein
VKALRVGFKQVLRRSIETTAITGHVASMSGNPTNQELRVTEKTGNSAVVRFPKVCWFGAFFNRNATVIGKLQFS